MYNVVSYKDKPAVVISANDTVATVMYFIEENNMVQAKMETIYDKTLLSDYSCPHADETDPARMYCTDGKCKYSLESPAKLSFMCPSCLAASLIFDDPQR
jgi:hypothetical protein